MVAEKEPSDAGRINECPKDLPFLVSLMRCVCKSARKEAEGYQQNQSQKIFPNA